MDEYIIKYQGDWLLDHVHNSMDDARDYFVEHICKHPDDALQVLKINVAEGTCIDVTGDMANLTFPDWDKDAHEDEQMPYVYAMLNCQRLPFNDNNEHRTYRTPNGSLAAGGYRG